MSLIIYLLRRVTQRKYAKELTSIFENKFDLPKESLPIVFIDSHYNRSVPEGKIGVEDNPQ